MGTGLLRSHAASYAEDVTGLNDQESQPSRRERRIQGLGRRMMRGTEQTSDEELKQSQDVLTWALRKHAPDSSFVVKAMIEVADQLARQGRDAEEVVLREKVVAGLQKNFGPEHESSVNAEWKLAMCLVKLERPQEAETLFGHVLAAKTVALGHDDPETLAVMAWCASVAKKLGRVHDARVLQEQVVAGYELAGVGKEALAMLAALNLAATLTELGAFDEASRLLRHVLDVRSRTLGPDDVNTLDVREILASVSLMATTTSGETDQRPDQDQGDNLFP